MMVLDIKRASIVAAREQAQGNSVKYLLLGVLDGADTWYDYNNGGTSRSKGVFYGFRNADELAWNMRSDVNESMEEPACLKDLFVPLGASLPPLITL